MNRKVFIKLRDLKEEKRLYSQLLSKSMSYYGSDVEKT